MTTDRVFLDANVLFSLAYGSPGLARLWKSANRGRSLLLASRYVIEEARRNLDLPAQLERLESLLAHIQIVLEADTRLPCPIEIAEKDRPVLMAAIAAKADFLLTGDRKHFGKYFGKTVGGVKICMPRDYLLKIHQA